MKTELVSHSTKDCVKADFRYLDLINSRKFQNKSHQLQSLPSAITLSLDPHWSKARRCFPGVPGTSCTAETELSFARLPPFFKPPHRLSRRRQWQLISRGFGKTSPRLQQAALLVLLMPESSLSQNQRWWHRPSFFNPTLALITVFSQ